jgi:hypothetical protein
LLCNQVDPSTHLSDYPVNRDLEPELMYHWRPRILMTPRTGILVSLLVGGTIGIIASFVPMIFGPLVFPQGISGPTLGEDIVVFSIPAFFLIFGAAGFFLAQKLVVRHIDRHDAVRRTFT